jgi:hypothetical protein
MVKLVRIALVFYLLTLVSSLAHGQARYKGGAGSGFSFASCVLQKPHYTFELYPNPAKAGDIVTTKVARIDSIQITNSSGKLVSISVLPLNTKALAPGIYFLNTKLGCQRLVIY